MCHQIAKDDHRTSAPDVEKHRAKSGKAVGILLPVRRAGDHRVRSNKPALGEDLNED
jgi:hypothetical protein